MSAQYLVPFPCLTGMSSTLSCLKKLTPPSSLAGGLNTFLVDPGGQEIFQYYSMMWVGAILLNSSSVNLAGDWLREESSCIWTDGEMLCMGLCRCLPSGWFLSLSLSL